MKPAVQTFFTSSAKGTGVRGIELDRCYEGPYDDQGRRHGQGRYKYPNHMVFEGTYVHGLKHGQGRLQFADGGCYEGQFEGDEISGRGTRHFPKGDVYEGLFKMGEMHGPGTMSYANGDSFQGTFVKNVIQGVGVKRFSSGDVYEGDFSANKINGVGTMKYKCGDSYEGHWQDGKRSGQGRCVYGYGDVYEGEWQADLPHGEGKLSVLLGGLRYEGTFLRGVPTQIPVKMNVSFVMPPGQPAAKKPVKGAAVDETPVMPVVLGTPLASPITLFAQHEVPLTAEEAAALEALAQPPAKGAPKPPPPPENKPVVTEPAAAGKKWETCEMESQRLVWLTLHSGPPQPLAKGRLLGLSVVNVMDKETGEPRLRVLLLPAQLEPPLPMARTPDGAVLHGLEAQLSQGCVQFESLVIGSSEPEAPDNEVLGGAGGAGYLVASSWAIRPGFIKVQLPEGKAKK